MIKKLTPRSRNWIFYNIKRFHSEDQYLKNLDSSFICSGLKNILYESETFDELLKKLNKDEFNKPFSFYRKNEKYFHYPSLLIQVRSLVECWEELRSTYRNIYNGHEDEYEQVGDEPFSEKNEKTKISALKRKTFGNKININSTFSLKEEASVHRHIMSSNKYFKCSFGFEYNSFKSRCLKELGNVEKREKKFPYFFQTDLKAFYHNLRPRTIIKILENYNLPLTKEWLKKIEEMYPEEGLPIGWMLSGIIVDLVMVEFSSFINKKTDKFKEIKISKIENISYVDDLVFFLWMAKEIPEKKEFEKQITVLVQELITEFFDGSNVEIHKAGSAKVKFIQLDKESATLLKTNWHDIDILTSMSDESLTNKKWTALDEFLLPSDNDLFLNENAQFFNNIQNLKAKVESGEFKELDDFWPYAEKALYKISKDKKYLQSVLDLMFLFFSLDLDEEENKAEKIALVWEGVKRIDDLNILDVVQYLKSFIAFSNRKNNELHNELIFAVKEVLSFVIDKNEFKVSQDFIFLCSFLKGELVKKDFDLEGVVLDIGNSSLYFWRTNLVALEYYNLYGKLTNKINYNINPFLLSDVMLTLNRKNGVAAENLIAYLDQITFDKKIISKKRLFLKAFFEESAFELLSNSSVEELSSFASFLKKAKVQCSLLSELETVVSNYSEIYRNYEVTQVELFRKYIESVSNYADIKYQYKRPASFKFKILTSASSKPYVYYREIVTHILFSISSIRDALRFVFFQYRPIDSVVFISWKALPNMFNGISHIGLSVAKEILKLRVQSLIQDGVGSKRESFPFNRFQEAVRGLSKKRLTYIDLAFFDSNIAGKERGFSSNKIKLMVGNLEINVSDDINKNELNINDHFRLLPRTSLRIHQEVMRVLRLAVQTRCHVVCFPELTIPQAKLLFYLDFCGKNNLILIAGIEYYDLTSVEVVNPTIISFPTKPSVNPLNKSYHAYIQFKNYLSIKEIDEFKKKVIPRTTLIEGKEIFVFKDKRVNNFSVLTCSDFLSLEIKYQLQGEIQTLFVPAMNYDNTTYHHMAQAAIRELYCICVVCNNSFMGGSLVSWPFRKENKRTLLGIEGISLPKGHYLTIKPAVMKELQDLGSDKHFHFDDSENILQSDESIRHKDFKQVPPDWFDVIKRKKT